jgi:hypothetical protein
MSLTMLTVTFCHVGKGRITICQGLIRIVWTLISTKQYKCGKYCHVRVFCYLMLRIVGTHAFFYYSIMGQLTWLIYTMTFFNVMFKKCKLSVIGIICIRLLSKKMFGLR